MDQIIKNYMFIFIIPFLVGVVVRFLFQRTKRAYLITSVIAVLTVIGWVVFYTVPSHGSELYGIIALLLTCAAVGTLLTGLVVQAKRHG